MRHDAALQALRTHFTGLACGICVPKVPMDRSGIFSYADFTLTSVACHFTLLFIGIGRRRFRKEKNLDPKLST